jgi:hypothetical protein
MGTRIEITLINGTAPFDVYMSDVFDNYNTYLGQITGAVPPVQYFSPPSIFNTAPSVKLKIIDANGCELFKILECRNGCAFDITITFESCVLNIDVTDPSCAVDFTIYDPDCECEIIIA